jgi:hypothetical protein
MSAAIDPFAGLEPELANELGGFAPAPEPKQEKPWPDITPLPSLLPVVPEMPAKIVPAAFRNFVSDIAERMQVATEVPAASLVVALSAIVGGSMGIFPKRFDSWCVIPNLWGLVAARSGMLKTPAIDESTKPLGILEHHARMQYAAEDASRKADEEIAAARLSALKTEIGKAAKNKDESALTNLKNELVEYQHHAEGQKSALRRYRVNDATIEKLLEILVENPRGLFVYRDELSGWLRGLDKIGRETDRAFYLESWNGNQPYTTDRIGRGTIHVPALCLSIFGGIQPAKLAAYVSDAIDNTSNDDGLIQRFQLSVYPEIPKVWNLIDRQPDKQARERVARIFHILDSFNPAVLGVSFYANIPAIHFDDEAQNLFNDWIVNLQRRILQGEGSPAFESHLSKYRSLMPSLALLFHLVDWADSQISAVPGNISSVSVEAAILAAAWVDYLELHARKIYAGALNPDLQAAHLIVQKIEQGKIKDGSSVRSIYRNQWTGLQTKERVFQGLLILSEFSYLRLANSKGEEGRPSSDTIEINPKFRSDSNGV